MKLFLLVFLLSSLFAKKPDLFLLNNYTDKIDVSSWYMSEKLDGVRAYWDGKKLISRSGKIFNPPKFFTEKFPKYKLDGELWSKRADFSNISSIVNTKNNSSKWVGLTYNIFEVPEQNGTLLKRLSIVKETKYIKVIKQIKVKNKQHLKIFFKDLENKGAEGIVVRDGSLNYFTGRSSKALKLKSYTDEECRVVSYNNGHGKYENMLGSINCKMKNGKIIKIGSGLSDNERRNAPKINSVITFKYYGLTSKGNPRFPIFLREFSK
jgi:DNA ligase-1